MSTHILNHLLGLLGLAVAGIVFVAILLGWPASGYALLGAAASWGFFQLSSHLNGQPATLRRALAAGITRECGWILLFISLGAALVAIAQNIINETMHESWSWRGAEIHQAEVWLHDVFAGVSAYLNSDLLILALATIFVGAMLASVPRLFTWATALKSWLSRLALILVGATSLSFFAAEALDDRYSQMAADLQKSARKATRELDADFKKITATAIVAKKMQTMERGERLAFQSLLRASLSSKRQFERRRNIRLVADGAAKAGPTLRAGNHKPNATTAALPPKHADIHHWHSILELQGTAEAEWRQASRLAAARAAAVEALAGVVQQTFPALPSKSASLVAASLTDAVAEAMVNFTPLRSIVSFNRAVDWVSRWSAETKASISQWSWSNKALTGQSMASEDAVLALLAARAIAQMRAAAAARARARAALPWYRRIRWPRLRVRP